jgi:hypothetical protein
MQRLYIKDNEKRIKKKVRNLIEKKDKIETNELYNMF